jgi:hypothetical protein
MRIVEERVTSLEDILADFITHTESALDRLSMEMQEFKEESRADRQSIREEMREFRKESEADRKSSKEEMQEFKEESRADRQSMREEMMEFKEEMRLYRERAEADRRSMNKQWGALANKMGTLVEDLIAPAAGAVVEKYFGCEPLIRTERYRKRLKKGDDFEVDVLVVCEEKVFMIEVRSSPDQQYVNEIIKKASKFMDFFPEYKDRELIPILASLVFEDNLIKHATKKGLYLMSYREWDYMDIINFDAVKRT